MSSLKGLAHMASPSPMMSTNHHHNHHQQSPSPPPLPPPPPHPTANQTLSKRDKRRNLISNSLSDLTTNFHQAKDEHYRSQLSILNAEIRAVAETNCFSDDGGLLPDIGADIETSLVEFLRSSGIILPPNSERSGKFFKKFVDDVNSSAETKDVEMTELWNSNLRYEEMINVQKLLALHHADAEYDHLLGTIRSRLLARLQSARKRLFTEKDHLEASDSTLSFLHPAQYSVLQADRSPGSRHNNNLNEIFSSINSGGAVPTRKLRGRKGEESVSEVFSGGSGFMAALANLEGAGILNGNGVASGTMSPGGANGKRKRGTGRSSMRDAEDLFGPRNGASTPPTPSDPSDLNAEQRQALAASALIKPLYSIDKLFTDKEINVAGTSAAMSTAKYYTELYKQRNTPEGLSTILSALANGGVMVEDASALDEDTQMEDEGQPQGPTTRTTSAQNSTGVNLSNAPTIPHTFLNQRLIAPTPSPLRQEEIQSDLDDLRKLLAGGGGSTAISGLGSSLLGGVGSSGRSNNTGLGAGGVAMNRAEGASSVSRRGGRDADDDGPVSKRQNAGLGISSTALERRGSGDGAPKKSRNR